MAEYIVDIEDGRNVASVQYNIAVEPFMRIGLVTATFNIGNATEIVRCKDCKYQRDCYCDHPKGSYMNAVLPVEPYGFCAWGEPRVYHGPTIAGETEENKQP